MNTDLTRDEAIQWCIDNKADPSNPVFPPPTGWMWGDGGGFQILTPIFTNNAVQDDDSDIESFDIFLRIAANHKAQKTRHKPG